MFCLIIDVIFIGLGRAYRLWRYFKLLNGEKGWQTTKGWNHFYGRSLPLKTPCKKFNLAIRGGLF